MLFVEGGGDHNSALASECRRAFSKLFDAARVSRKPRVVACGGRTGAFEQFRLAVSEGRGKAWLLVDAEDVVSDDRQLPWDHVRQREGDRWERPAGAGDEQLHLMVACMESWLCADREALRAVMGPKLEERKLPPDDAAVEDLSKERIYADLERATRNTPAGRYHKGSHSFRVLAVVRPERLEGLRWGKRFLDAMRAG